MTRLKSPCWVRPQVGQSRALLGEVLRCAVQVALQCSSELQGFQGGLTFWRCGCAGHGGGTAEPLLTLSICHSPMTHVVLLVLADRSPGSTPHRRGAT